MFSKSQAEESRARPIVVKVNAPNVKLIVGGQNNNNIRLGSEISAMTKSRKKENEKVSKWILKYVSENTDVSVKWIKSSKVCFTILHPMRPPIACWIEFAFRLVVSFASFMCAGALTFWRVLWYSIYSSFLFLRPVLCWTSALKMSNRSCAGKQLPSTQHSTAHKHFAPLVHNKISFDLFCWGMSH